LQIEIRPAHLAEAADLIRIHFEAVHSVAHEQYSLELLDAWSPQPSLVRTEWMRNVLLSEGHLVLVATVDGRVRGFVICLPSDGFVQALYVQPEKSRMGVGNALLAASESASAEAGAAVCKLFASQNAIDFYAALGYVAGTRSTLRLSGGAELACTQMRKQLAQL
jgi:putative acetyltransferase